jgi:hypothetical protein
MFGVRKYVKSMKMEVKMDSEALKLMLTDKRAARWRFAMRVT